VTAARAGATGAAMIALMLAISHSQSRQLLVQIIPAIAGEDSLALKGGAAINLYYGDVPHLCETILVAGFDLVVPIETSDPRAAALDPTDRAYRAPHPRLMATRAGTCQ
jgi:hypothetical protein